MALGDLIEFNIHCVSNKIQFEEVTCYSSCIDLSEEGKQVVDYEDTYTDLS